MAATSSAKSSSSVAISSSRASTRRPRVRTAVLVANMTGSAPARGRSEAASTASCWRETPRRRSRSSSGPVKPRWRIWFERLDLGRAAAAFDDHQGPDRLDVAVSSLGRPERSTGLGRPGRLHRVRRVGLARAAAGLAVGAVDLDHLHPGGTQEPGKPGAVGAGALHPPPVQPGRTTGTSPAACRYRRGTPRSSPRPAARRSRPAQPPHAHQDECRRRR